MTVVSHRGAAEIVSNLEAAGARLRLSGGRIRLGGVPTRLAHLLDELRAGRDEAVAILEARTAAFELWLEDSCVGGSRAATSSRILYREYQSGTKDSPLAYEAFIEHLKDCGYALQEDGMIGGLMFAFDFVDLAEAEQDDVPAVKEQSDESSHKVRLCLGRCRRLMMHHSTDGWWICTECKTPGWSHTYVEHQPGEHSARE